MSAYEEALEKIEAQQSKEQGSTAVWMVGEQLKDMLRVQPELGELVSQDLEKKAMSLKACEAQLKAWADGHRTGNFACVPPAESDRIIREFYGLPKRGEAPERPGRGKLLDLADFL